MFILECSIRSKDNLSWRDFRRSLVQALAKTGSAVRSDKTVQGFIHPGLETLQCSLSGQHVSEFDFSQNANLFPFSRILLF